MSRIVCFAFVSLLVAVASVRSSSVSITDNGYSGIVVAFSPRINQTVGEPLIERIKEIFTNASIALYKATRNRAYFKEVTILVPQSWKKTYQTAGAEVFGEADIRIDEPNAEYGDGPYTLQPLGCGSEGLFIHLTPEYLKNLNTTSTAYFGDPGKTLVHEWAHLRYGIFDEFGYSGDPMFPMAYYNDMEEMGPNSCTNGRVKGTWKDVVKDAACTLQENNGLPNDDCAFIPDSDNNKEITSSIQSYHFLPEVFTFCDDGEVHYHNPIAPNKHNVLCESQSTWSVITQHKDFKETNKPREIKNLTPNFPVVQLMEATYCLVLDVSGSMKDDNRLVILKETVTRWIRDEVSEGVSVGVVTFSTTAKLVYKMTRMDAVEKDKLILIINGLKIESSTGIGRGLETGKAVLAKHRGGSGGIIILVTDGQETLTLAPTIIAETPKLVAAKIRVVAIALHTQDSRSMEYMVQKTGGKMFLVPKGSGTEQLGMAFYEALTYQASEFDLAQKIYAKSHNQSSVSYYTGSFAIDATIGNNTVIEFKSAENVISNVTITGPNTNDDISKTAVVTINEAKLKRFKYVSLQEGVYYYNITKSPRSTNPVIEVSVLSKARSLNVQPIITRSWVQEEPSSTKTKPRIVILAEVKQGNNPVINAAVMAKIDRPDASSILLQLFDNGNGAPDVTRNDGIYARYFTQFNGKDRYAVTAQVTDDGKASIREVGFTGSRSMPVTNKFQANPKVTEKPTGKFGRESSSGSFTLTEDIKEGTVDLFPPSRVSDLQVASISDDVTTVTFKWTAPGDDFDYGNASSYQFRYATNWTLLSQNFDNETHLEVDLAPKTAGETETITVSIPGLGERTLYVAMVAVDKSGQHSKLSNVAVLGKQSPINVADSSNTVVIIVGAVLAGLVVIVVIIAAVMFHKKKKAAQAAAQH